MRTATSTLLLFALPLLAGWDWLTSPDRDVQRGNRLFARGQYGEALAAYRKAEGRGGDSARLGYDIGTALYKMAEDLPEGSGDRDELLREAELLFRRGAEASDKLLKSSAYYNAGNALFQRRKYSDAIAAYREALRANPANDDARYNLELALRRRRELRPRELRPREWERGQGAQGSGDGRRGARQLRGESGQRNRRFGSQGAERDGSGGDRPERRPLEGERSKRSALGSTAKVPRETEGPNSALDFGGRERGGAPASSVPGRENQNARSAVQGEAKRKLEALERRSRELQRRRLRSTRGRRGSLDLDPTKDW